MPETTTQPKLHDGTLIRHKVAGYEGRIDGTTEIRTCFTAAGVLLDRSNSKQTFQYRIVIKGESMRRIAPPEDLEILDGVVGFICPQCHFSFQTKPGLPAKPGGRCECGGWICPSCLACRDGSGGSLCLKGRKRLARRELLKKKAR